MIWARQVYDWDETDASFIFWNHLMASITITPHTIWSEDTPNARARLGGRRMRRRRRRFVCQEINISLAPQTISHHFTRVMTSCLPRAFSGVCPLKCSHIAKFPITNSSNNIAIHTHTHIDCEFESLVGAWRRQIVERCMHMDRVGGVKC